MFAERLKQFRREHGLTQADLAHTLHVDASRISRWERGEPMPHQVIDRLNSAYAINAYDWFEQEDPQKQQAADQGSPRVIHMNNGTKPSAEVEENWRAKALDVLSRMTDMLESLLKSSRGGGRTDR
ncbi:MAG: helix-turn-helix transcriptional regulator [Flavobacteriales bacterium]|nr:helix-turn-helix transcriptional regulator [Flavobacteriales bacterium]